MMMTMTMVMIDNYINHHSYDIIIDDICHNNDGDDFDDKDLGWDTLEMRRIQFRLTLMYKLTRGLIDIDSRKNLICLLYTSPSPRDLSTSRMPSSA